MKEEIDNRYFALMYAQVSTMRFYLTYLLSTLQKQKHQHTLEDWDHIITSMYYVSSPALRVILDKQELVSEDLKRQWQKDNVPIKFMREKVRPHLDATEYNVGDLITTVKSLNRACKLWLKNLEAGWKESGLLPPAESPEHRINDLLQEDYFFQEEWRNTKSLFLNLQQTDPSTNMLITEPLPTREYLDRHHVQRLLSNLEDMTSELSELDSDDQRSNAINKIEATSHRLTKALLFLFNTFRTEVSDELLQSCEGALENARVTGGQLLRARKSDIVHDIAIVQMLAAPDFPVGFLQHVLDSNNEQLRRLGG